jgi:hypothetical protein
MPIGSGVQGPLEFQRLDAYTTTPTAVNLQCFVTILMAISRAGHVVITKLPNCIYTDVQQQPIHSLNKRSRDHLQSKSSTDHGDDLQWFEIFT